MDETVTLRDIQSELIKIENQMGAVGRWNLHDRWKSGRLLVQLRNPETNYLPKGRLTTVAATLKVSTRELSDRMRVADTYRTDAAFQKAARSRASWTDLLRSLPQTREARTGSTRPPRNRVAILYNTLGHVLAENLETDEVLRLARALYDALGDREPVPPADRADRAGRRSGRSSPRKNRAGRAE